MKQQQHHQQQSQRGSLPGSQRAFLHGAFNAPASFVSQAPDLRLIESVESCMEDVLRDDPDFGEFQPLQVLCSTVWHVPIFAV